MWLNFVFAFGLLMAAEAHITCTPKSCRASILSVQPMCGSDNISYPNKCLLELAQCYNPSIMQQHKGQCRKAIKCSDYVKTLTSSILEPKCRSDGNFAGSQCSSKLGYCWCVNSHGVPMDYTLTQYSPSAKPRCSRKKSTRRRSSPKNGRKSSRPCKREDKAKFNINLVKIFQTEFIRENDSAATLEGNLFRTVLDWKFKQMDKNNDNMLDKTEYKDLKKIVKKAVKPKRCAKTFAKACDINEDEFIGKQEWAECLTRDGIDEGPMEESNADLDEDDEDISFPEYPPISSFIPSTHTPPDGVLQPQDPGVNESSPEQTEEEPVDCRSDRLTALGEMRANSENHLYVPECTPDGRYQKIQCYKSTGYCWCVHEDTGKNIPGTSVKNQVPKCDQVVSVSRSIKGCPEAKKNAFLKALIDYLHDRMVKDINGTKIASANRPAWNTTKEEKVASWSFVIFDKNKNKIMEKNEWKFFKETISSVKGLRKCGKKLPRYCDKNKDKEITLTEWLECLSKRNHFTDILKED